MSSDTLIKVEGLKVYFPIAGKGLFGGGSGEVRAVDDINLEIKKGETLGLVGESGSGKTTVGRALLRAVDATGGTIRFWHQGEEIDLRALGKREMRSYRRYMQLIFQDPYASLNPRMTVRDIIAEPLEAQGLCKSKKEVDERVREIAARCKLNLEHLRRFPHAFSGGQRQRICIARALVSNPDFVVCDESVSALDVSIQAEILNLLADLQKELQLTYLFIAHDLSVVAHIADRVAVMYVGQLMELAPAKALFARPHHPYTKALLSAIPRIDPDKDFKPQKLPGEIPNPANVPEGCRFHTRCPYARERCRGEAPAWRQMGEEHFVACHFAEELLETP
jgi:peptide/nickel transport system ATP-binding protein